LLSVVQLVTGPVLKRCCLSLQYVSLGAVSQHRSKHFNIL